MEPSELNLNMPTAKTNQNKMTYGSLSSSSSSDSDIDDRSKISLHTSQMSDRLKMKNRLTGDVKKPK